MGADYILSGKSIGAYTSKLRSKLAFQKYTFKLAWYKTFGMQSENKI